MSYDIKIKSTDYEGHLKKLAEAEAIINRRRDEMEMHRLLQADGICRVVFRTRDGLEAYDHVTKMAREPGPVPMFYDRSIRSDANAGLSNRSTALDVNKKKRIYRFTGEWVYGSPVYQEIDQQPRDA